MSTKKIGNLHELQCITRMTELGAVCSTPYGDSSKYDFIIDVNNHLYKIQAKHPRVHRDESGEVDFIVISTQWKSGYTRNKKSQRHKYNGQEVDYFICFYEGKSYLIKQNECSFEKILRIKNPKNGNKKLINFLEDYLDEEVMSKL